VLVKIVVVGVVVILALGALKNGWILRRTGLIGSCSVYSTAPSGSQLELCMAGRLDGRPNLSGQGCTAQSVTGRDQYWSCPTPLASQPSGV
jgi:hypothetical protein